MSTSITVQQYQYNGIFIGIVARWAENLPMGPSPRHPDSQTDKVDLAKFQGIQQVVQLSVFLLLRQLHLMD